MRRSLVIALFTLALAMPLTAQSTWGLRTGIGAEKKIGKGLEAGFDVKYHLTDDFKNTDRWSVGASLSKRLYRNEAKTFNVKAGMGYKFMNVYTGWTTKYKGDRTDIEDGLDKDYYISNKFNFNVLDSYVDTRHRITAYAQASAEMGRFKLSLRESYQFTHTDSVSYSKDKYRYKNGKWKDVETEMDGKSASDKSMLRSKLSLDYNIPHFKYDPFISYELFNSLDNGFELQKSRIQAGIEFSINKKHNFEVAYLWQNQHDDDEPAGSFICIDYKFSF
jgi:hypothetical protein